MATGRRISVGACCALMAGGLLLSQGALAAAQSGSTPTASATASAVTEQDKEFVNNTAQDTNFEIVTSRLALEKSKAADVRAYAGMVIRDHTRLRQMVFSANKATGLKNIGTISMMPDDLAAYTKLQGLDGTEFDQAYIKVLLKGNQQAVEKAKAEAAGSGVPAVKSLAERRLELDTKHAAKAKELAQAHGVQA